MHYVRPLDEAEVLPTGHPGLQAKLLSHQESAMIFGASVCDGGRAAGLHYHHRDQIYFQLSGTMTAQLGSQVHQVGPDTLVYIPAGLPHCNWNEGPGDEGHLEVITPATQIGAPLAYMVDTPDLVPAEWTPRGPAAIIEADIASKTESTDGERRHGLIGLTTTTSIGIDYVEIASGAGWRDTRIHQADRHYFVLDGCLDFEIALMPHRVGPDTLVSVPAGVPHRIVNNGTTAQKHLEMTSTNVVTERLSERPVRITLSHTG